MIEWRYAGYGKTKIRVVGGLHVSDRETQVYWKAIFTERKAPIQSATVRVQLPQSLSGKVFHSKIYYHGVCLEKNFSTDRASIGLENKYPCTSSQSNCRKQFSCSFVSTPSAIALIPKV